MVALVLAVATVPAALAQCGLPTKLVKPASWSPASGAAHLMRASLASFDDNDQDEPSIVGMWHVVFTIQTANGEPASGTLDNSVVVWHSDGTEIMNSSRPAQDGNFCLGVWARTGRLKYFLNHIPWQGNDPSNAPSGIGNPSGGAQLLEQVTLSPDGNHYSGKFAFTAYDAKGNTASPLFTGTISATRITTSTPFSSLL
jgi:hypothetical protein